MTVLFFARPVLLVAFVLLAKILLVLSEELRYCSGQNTAGDFEGVPETYQSNGHCRDQCSSQYAFAVISGDDCWCSDFAPGRTASISACDNPCNGYPSEQCGGDGFFAYLALEKQPSGTIGAPAPPSPSPSAEDEPDEEPEEEPDDDTESDDEPTTEPDDEDDQDDFDSVDAGLNLSFSDRSSESTTTSARSTTSSNADAPETPVTSVQTVTVSGEVVVETVLAMPEEELTAESSDSSSPGLIAGAVVGSLSGVGALGIFAFWFLRNRRRDGDRGHGSTGLESAKAGQMPRRNTSLLSRVGILRSEKSYPGGNTAGTTHSGSGGLGGVEDASSLTPVSERRSSRPLIFDQRLNPYALMEYDNGSQTSLATMADDRDYTRPLNVRNPDPPGRVSASTDRP